MRGPGSRPTQRPLPLTLSHHLLTVAVTADTAESIAFDLWSFGAVGVEEQGESVRAAFADPAAAALARDRLEPSAEISVVEDDFGLDAARDLLTVQEAGRFAIHPPWCDPPDGRVGIEIDPGHAFGSGSHPSTRLALELLGSTPAPASVFDVGCGTGVLAIGAALLGAEVVAVDVDPVAVATTHANAARNGVADRVDARLGSAEARVEAVDLAIVNLTIDIHEAIATRLSHVHRRLIVAGLLGDSQLARAARAYGATIETAIGDDRWMAAVLQRS